jgi:uncharacterized protein with PIN domain
MAQSIRFHLDEHCPTALAAGLRLRGIDVTTTPEVGLLHATDEEQLAYAGATGRVIVTHDEDFLALATGRTDHAGICYCHQNKYTLGRLIDAIQLVWEVFEPDDLQGRVEYL